MKGLRIACITCLMLITFAIFSQDIKGVYFRGSRVQPSTGSEFISMSVTLLTDASKNIGHPTAKVDLGPNVFPHYMVLPNVNVTNVNSTNIATYTGNINVFSFAPSPVSYTDSFWVAGIKNFSVSDKSRLNIFADVVFPDFVDIAPEVTNLPLSLSNFTVSGNQVLYNPFCQDADGDSLSYDLAGAIFFSKAGWYIGYLPANATINPVTGLFSFSKDSTDIGLYAFTIYITDWKKINGTMGQIGVSNLSFVMTTNLTLGVKDFSDPSLSFGLYPNPVNNTLNFKSGALNENEKVKLEIINTLGETVLQRNDFTLSQSVDVSFLSQGIYFINISNGTRTFSNKFVKTGD